jgi:hypothetical protein
VEVVVPADASGDGEMEVLKQGSIRY